MPAEETPTVEIADDLRARLLGRERGAPLVVVERRTFWARFGGGGLDALDIQMFGLAIPAPIAEAISEEADAEGEGGPGDTERPRRVQLRN